jgi:hypothetical protein
MVNMPNTRRLTKRSRPKRKKKKKNRSCKNTKTNKRKRPRKYRRGGEGTIVDMLLCHEDDKELHPILCGNNHHFCKPCIARHLPIKTNRRK